MQIAGKRRRFPGNLSRVYMKEIGETTQKKLIELKLSLGGQGDMNKRRRKGPCATGVQLTNSLYISRCYETPFSRGGLG